MKPAFLSENSTARLAINTETQDTEAPIHDR